MDGAEGALAGLLHEAVAAAVLRVGQVDHGRKGEPLERLAHKRAEHALAADRRDERHIRARAAEDVGDVVGAAADGEALGFGMEVFLRPGQVIHPDDDVHTGGADDEHILHIAFLTG